MARTSMRRSTGEASDANVIVVPDADAPTVDPRATFVRSGTRYSWGLGSWLLCRLEGPPRTPADRGLRPGFDGRRGAPLQGSRSDGEAPLRAPAVLRRSLGPSPRGRRDRRGARRVGRRVAGLPAGLGGDAEPSLKGGAVTEAIRYDDPSGGFSMRVPAGWNVVTSASGATQLVSQDGDVTVSIESMPAGDLGEVAADFMNSATDGWDDVSFESPVERELGGGRDRLRWHRGRRVGRRDPVPGDRGRRRRRRAPRHARCWCRWTGMPPPGSPRSRRSPPR